MDRTQISAADIATRSRWIDRIARATGGFATDARDSEQELAEEIRRDGSAALVCHLTTRKGQTVLDPFMGSGTTAVAARRLNRRFVGFEAVEAFHKAACQRLRDEQAGLDAVPSQEALM